MKQLKAICLLLLTIVSFSFVSDNFKVEQIKNERVKTAYKEKKVLLTELYTQKNLNFTQQQIFIRVFKKEAELELWARNIGSKKFTLVKTYPICSSSGELGPKRKNGDYQTPEGFYFIDRFNPYSNFYLSLGINYPNASDKILGNKGNLGGDIFIHGNCVTIGCMPLTDDKIKELYIAAVEAKSAGQSKIPVHIFPCRLSNGKWSTIEKDYADQPALVKFWQNLKPGYDYFEKNSILPVYTVDAKGSYQFVQ
jgi:murein L,D-transpeptidase YafK